MVDRQGGRIPQGHVPAFSLEARYRGGQTAVFLEYLDAVVAGIGHDQMRTVNRQSAGLVEMRVIRPGLPFDAQMVLSRFCCLRLAAIGKIADALQPGASGAFGR